MGNKGTLTEISAFEAQEEGCVHGCQRAKDVDREDYDGAAQKTVHPRQF